MNTQLNSEKEIKEVKFNSFLNKTIKLSSKRYYVRELLKYSNEIKILDDVKYEKYVKQFVQTNVELVPIKDETDFINSINNTSLLDAIKSLSCIERTVIFLLFEKQLTSKEASKILKICSDSVTRIRKRALKKITEYMKRRDK